MLLSVLVGLWMGIAWGAETELHEFVGTWKAEKASAVCSETIKIAAGARRNSVRLLLNGITYPIAGGERFPAAALASTQVAAGKKVAASTIGKFIRGKIVTAHIWEPQAQDWLGIGLRVWKLSDGKLLKRKAGITFQTKGQGEKDRDEEILEIDAGDAVHQWKVECVYVKVHA